MITVRMSKTVTVARRGQWYTQPLSPAVNHGNKLYNTNSPSASMMTVVRDHSHMCVRAMFTSRGYYSRAKFAATIQGRPLFEDGVYSKKYSTCMRNENLVSEWQNGNQ